MTPTDINALISDGLRCSKTPHEAAIYTGGGPAEVVCALLGEELVEVQAPEGGLTDCLLGRDDLDQWLERHVGAGRPA